SIMLLDHDRGVLRVVAARGLPEGVVGQAEVPVGEGVAGKVVQIGEAVLVEDISTDPRFARPNDSKYGSGAFMCLPVRVEGRVLGFTAVQPVAEQGAVDLNEVLREVVELTRPRWRDEAQMHAIDLDVTLELGELPRVAGEAPALREVIMNLVFNAIDAMQASGRIR